MDVMVFTPVHRLEPQTVQALLALEPGDGAVTLVLQRDNPRRTDDARADGWSNHLHQYQRGLELFQASRCDAMLVVESDMIPPPDALVRLAALPADVAFGCYVFRQGTGDVVNVLERYHRWPKQARNIGESLSVRGLWETAQEQGVIDCSGSGLGCTLIRRPVLEQAPFEAQPDNGFFDWHWVQTVYAQGWRMMADCNLHCGHVTPDGRVLWPSSK
jgi:hypothetical protein